MDAAVEDLAGLDDHDLLAGGVADGVAETRARGAVTRQAVLTPRAETVPEVSALWGLAEPRVRHELNVALFLEQYFPELWALCRAGQLDPGVLSGGTPVPAGLARAIAADPEATWYRMLTDPAGQMVELSTASYQPTAPIWRHVVARWGACFEPACHAPATQVELDHRTPWPRGETRTGNLWPACKRGHTAKHTPGYRIQQGPDGSLALRTRAGFSHPLTPPAQPTSDTWPDLPDLPTSADQDEPIQFCATELIEALTG